MSGPAWTIWIEGAERTLGFDELMAESRRLGGMVAEEERTLLRRRVAWGAMLLQVQAAMPEGVWLRWLEASGVHRKKAERAKRLAAEFGDSHGVLEADRLFAALNKIDPATYSDRAAFMAERVSLRKAETTLTETENHATRASHGAGKPSVGPLMLAGEVPSDDAGLLGLGEGDQSGEAPFDDGDDDDQDGDRDVTKLPDQEGAGDQGAAKYSLKGAEAPGAVATGIPDHRAGAEESGQGGGVEVRRRPVEGLGEEHTQGSPPGVAIVAGGDALTPGNHRAPLRGERRGRDVAGQLKMDALYDRVDEGLAFVRVALEDGRLNGEQLLAIEAVLGRVMKQLSVKEAA